MPLIVDNDLAHTVFGTAGDDTIDARGGNDTIIPQLGNDVVLGGAGLLDVLAVDYTTLLTNVTMSAPTLTGAVYSGFDAPGGEGVVTVGSAGSAGGAQTTFSGFAAGQYNSLWVGINAPQLATDGAIDEPGETLTFSSGLGTATAVWTGTSDVVSGTYTGPVLTRLTVTINSGGANWIDPTTIGLSGGPAAVSLINAPSFTYTAVFEVSSDGGGTWAAVNDFRTANSTTEIPQFNAARDFAFDDGGYSGVISDGVSNSVTYSNVESLSVSTGAGTDTLIGGRFHDDLRGGGANDTITGAGGNDTIMGGAGTGDVAVFSGSRADYTVTAQAGDAVTVTDNRPGSPDGSDGLSGVEILRFADGDVAANAAPVVDLDGTSGSFDFATSYTEGGAAANIGFSIGVTDPDSGDPIERADIVNTNPNPGDNFIVGPLPGGITLDPSSTSSHVILVGVASQATYAAALATVRFFSGSDDPTAGGNFNRILHTTVRDGSVDSAFATTTIAVTGVNDAPNVFAGPGDVASVFGVESNSPLTGTFTLTVNDPDSADTVSPTVAGVVASGTTLGLGSSNPQLQAMITLTPPSLTADVGEVNNLSWSFNSTPEAFDYLAQGESLVLTYTIQVADSGTPTLTDTQAITVTITGTNDAPVISNTGSDSLTIGVTETNAPLTGSATLTLVDPDYSDADAASVTTVLASGTTVGLTSTNPQLLAMLNVTGGLIAANPGTTSNLTYSFNSAPQAFDYLDDGESLTLTYTIMADDGHVGGTDTQDVTVVVTGANDTPDVFVGPGDVASVFGVEANSPLSGSFTLSVVDPDLSDSVTASVAGVVASGTTLGLPSTNAQLLAMMSLTPGAIAADPGAANNLAWTFNSAPEAFNYLDDGETLTLTYTIRVTDDSGATDDQAVTVTITGTNDAPLFSIIGGDSASAALADGSNPLQAHGTLTVTDPDFSDSVTPTLVSVVGSPPLVGPGWEALMTVSPPSLAANPGGPISNLHWSFTAGPSLFDYLAAGETQTLTYTLRVTDDSMESADQNVVITITGTNEAPTITSSFPPLPGVVEIPDGAPGENATLQAVGGTIGFADTDLSDTHSASFAPAAMGYVGSFTLGAVDQGANTVGWTFNVQDSDLNWLADGQTVTQTYNVTLNDGHGGTVVQAIVINLIGTNDAAHLSSDAVLLVQGTGPVSTNGTLTISDEDGPNTFQAQMGTHGSYGTFSINAAGQWSFLADSPFLSLAPGQVLTDIFTVHASDGTPTTVAVSIAGTNDVGIARQDSFVTDEAHAIGAGLNLFNDNGSGADNDPDNPLAVGAVNGDPSKVGQQITLPSGALVTVNANGTFSYNPNHAFDSLTLASGSMNQFAYDIFNYTLAGGSTASVLVRVNGLDTAADQLIGSISDNVITGTSGPDVFRLEQGGSDTAAGMAGNDGFYFGGQLDHGDNVDGGAGTDTVAMQGNTNVILGNVTNVEVLLALSGADASFGDTANNRYSYDVTSNDGNVAAGQTLTVQATGLLAGENLHFNGSAETDGNFRIFAGRGVDDLTGGGGSDGFFFGADGNLTGADHVDGGAGIDTLAMRGNYVGANAVVFTNGSFTNIEVLALLSGHTNEYGGVIVPAGYDYDVTMADGNLAAGQVLDVVAGRLGADESLRFDGRAETNGAYRIFSGSGDDTLWGGAGNDMIYGGLGADRMTGGAGADMFVYRSAAESTSTGYDTIVGFDWHVDRIDAPGGLRSVSQSASGALSTASFDANLAAGLAGVLGSGQAALFTASSGTLAGHVFLVIDANGVAGYQAGADLVIDLVSPVTPIDPAAGIIV